MIAAFAQSKGDYNTWDYERKYGSLVVEGKVSVACGDFSALIENYQQHVAELFAANKQIASALKVK